MVIKIRFVQQQNRVISFGDHDHRCTVQYLEATHAFLCTCAVLCRLVYFHTDSHIFVQTCTLLHKLEHFHADLLMHVVVHRVDDPKFLDHWKIERQIYRPPVVDLQNLQTSSQTSRYPSWPAKYNQVPVIQKPTLLEPLMTEYETSVYPKIRREMRLLCRMYYTVCHLFHILDNDGKTRWLEKSSLIIITTPGISSEGKHYICNFRKKMI